MIKKRVKYNMASKVQKQIVILMVLPPIVIFIMIAIVPLFLQANISKNIQLGNNINYTEVLVELIRQWQGFIIFFICALYSVSTFLVYKCLNPLGGLPRIIREMDEIIAGQSKEIITARPGDNMTQEMLNRINVFIKSHLELKKINEKIN